MCIRIDSISIVAGLRSSYTFIVTCCDKYSYDENWWSWREFICLLYCLSWNRICKFCFRISKVNKEKVLSKAENDLAVVVN